MREILRGHSAPTAEQYDNLWKRGAIILDTNALLDLYRLPDIARDDLFSVLEAVSERLWIPHHVALEFERNRLSVIDAGRAATESVMQSMENLTKQIQEKVQTLQIEKRGLGLDVDTIVGGLKNASADIKDTLQIVHNSQVDISSNDPTRDRIHQIFAGKVGAAPKDQAAVDLLMSGGEQRYADQIPPGYADAEKAKDPKGAEFIHNGLKYQRKFGDLIIWRQVIDYVKEAEVESVIFVTSDRKPDWWQIFKGRVIGPQPELLYEISRETNINTFWMYTLDNFVENSNILANTEISETTVEQIRSVGEPYSENVVSVYISPNRRDSEWGEWHGVTDERKEVYSAELAVRHWLASRKGEVLPYYERFPDFIVNESGRVVGYEVKRLPLSSPEEWPEYVKRIIMTETPIHRKAPISALALVFWAPVEIILSMSGSSAHYLKRQLEDAISFAPVDGIIVGYLSSEGFEVWAEVGRPF